MRAARASRAFLIVISVAEPTTDRAIELCRDAHRRLLTTVDGITDDIIKQPSLLPGWTVGHVLTHVARNAEGHTRRLAGALEGREVARYPGGQPQRGRDIEDGASRSAADQAHDVATSIAQLEEIWRRSQAAGWPNAGLMAGDHYRTDESPLRRLREVEVHHVDLALDYSPEDWPEEYVDWELPWTLERVPPRIIDRREVKLMLAWLIGRGEPPKSIRFKPWL